MSVISSLPAKCKDCYRCIRACPVKAINLRNGQAQVVPERCIVCGLCVTTCPQGAKTVQGGLPLVTQWRKKGIPMVASLAPSFPAAFPHLDPLQVIAGLQALGFIFVEETAHAATAVAKHYHGAAQTASDRAVISSCCPVIVNLVEMYYPELIPNLAPTISPMVLHGHKLKERFADAKVVFVGPCAGKIDETRRESSSGAIDAVITFKQLQRHWDDACIDPALLEPTPPAEINRAPRLYPLGRGILESSGLPTTSVTTIVSITGIERCIDVFKDLGKVLLQPAFVEALACQEGCVGGSEMPCAHSAMTRREAVMRYHEKCSHQTKPSLPSLGLKWEATPCTFTSRVPPSRDISEAEIRQVLLQIGQAGTEDARDCGGCGYDTCRDKAIATLQGYAELEMCVPFMKAKFESLSHLVVDSSPNGVIVTSYDLTIHQFNAEAERIFNRDGIPSKGAHLSAFLDPEDFIEVVATEKVRHKRVEYEQIRTVTRQVIYALPAYKLVVGIITDITDQEVRKRDLDAKHQQTIQRASAVIRNQMKLAQEIAGLLGEATAETKSTLLDLITSLTDENGVAI
ncbi:MAG: 4Fe-4S binding protein [Peptococcaceae bacterium]|nr:4Fe-4S binding protein [Peptococcaceae bacterium]